ncbi:MAG: HIT domain-containing protein [Acidobacteriia bacterium]|nr:HIT domain-containing protein [Terriglobia bacterium]
MDHLYTPWRYQFIRAIKAGAECIFCLAASTGEGTRGEQQARDRQRLVLYRGSQSFIILNRYPYTNGHLMIAPFAHLADLASCPVPLLAELMELAQRAEIALRDTYHPDGFNIGLNLGKSAGAGVEGHLHLHVVPRWVGDANFVSVIGETRLLPEELETTYDKLFPLLARPT